MSIKLTADRAAAVNTQTFWVEITPSSKPLKGARYLLINKAAGVAQIGPFRDDGWYTHFAGLPRFREDDGQCACGDRPAGECPGQWEPGCDLGSNEQHVQFAHCHIPRQATPEMIQAGRNTPVSPDEEDSAADYAAIWQAMYDAAPRPDPQKPTYEELEAAYAKLKADYKVLQGEYERIDDRWV